MASLNEISIKKYFYLSFSLIFLLSNVIKNNLSRKGTIINTLRKFHTTLTADYTEKYTICYLQMGEIFLTKNLIYQ